MPSRAWRSTLVAPALLSVGVDGALNLWSPATGLQACTIRADCGLAAVAASPDGRQIAAALRRRWRDDLVDAQPRDGVGSSDSVSFDFGFVHDN